TVRESQRDESSSRIVKPSAAHSEQLEVPVERVQCIEIDEVLAAGRRSGARDEQIVRRRWDGSAWTIVPSGTSNTLFGVWGSGPSDVWAVGQFDTALHWDGSAWTNIPTGMVATAGVWGSAPDDVWAAGSSVTMMHWDGSAWTSVVSGT